MKKIALIMAVLLLLTGCSGNVQETEPTLAEATCKQPPELTIVGVDVKVVNLGSTWNYVNADGVWVSDRIEGKHPMECKNVLKKAVSMDEVLELSFAVKPDSICVRTWMDTEFGFVNTVPGKTSVFAPAEILLKPEVGAYVYEVIAVWENDESFNGVAHYCFYLGYSEPAPQPR